MDNFKCIPSFIDLILQIEIHIAAESFHLHADESRQLVDNSSYKYLIHILLQKIPPACVLLLCVMTGMASKESHWLNGTKKKKKQIFVFLFNAHLQEASAHSGKL